MLCKVRPHYSRYCHFRRNSSLARRYAEKQRLKAISQIPARPGHTSPLFSQSEFSDFGVYWDIDPPRASQLNNAKRFFETHTPAFYFAASKFREFPLTSSTPEVAFLGRSNVGKSSLLNALLNRTTNRMARVSSKPGHTRTMNAIGVGGSGGGVKRIEAGAQVKEARVERWIGPGGVVVVDMPGYGFKSREDWGKEVMKYLYERKQLRRTFILIDAEHGLTRTDERFLEQLRGQGVQCQIILSKIDKMVRFKSTPPTPEMLEKRVATLQDICGKIRARLQTGPVENLGSLAAPASILTCSAETSFAPGRKVGIDGVRWAVLQAAGLEDVLGRRRPLSDVHVLEESQPENREISVR